MNAATNWSPSIESQEKPAGFDVFKIRADFPILTVKVHGKPLVYLDNAATTQKPQAVIDALIHYYISENANIHRGVHALSELATESFEQARVKIQRFLRAALAAPLPRAVRIRFAGVQSFSDSRAGVRGISA